MSPGTTPSSSETTMAITVLVPQPMSLIPRFRFTLPPEKYFTMAVEGGLPPPANQRQLAMPTPRLMGPSLGDVAARALASFHPEASAPSLMHSARPVVV